MNALFRPLLKYWYLVLGLTLIISVLSGWERTQSFESRARLLLKLGDEFLQSGADPDARASGRILLAEAINTDVQILTSYDQYEKVVEELGADTFRAEGADEGTPFGSEQAVAVLRGGLNIKSVENSAVIHLTYRHTDPARAKLVLSTLIETYLHERSRILRTGSISVLESIRDETSKQYVDTRDAFDAFLDGASTQDMEATLGLLRRQLMALGTEARDTRRQLSGDRRRIAVIDAEIAKQPARKEIFSEPRTNTALDGARNRLVELRVEEKQLLGKYTETSRPVSRARSEIAELERIIRDEEGASDRAVLRTGNNPIRDSLELQRTELVVSIAGAEARLEALMEQQAELGTELLELEGRYVTAGKLDDALVVAESRFRDIDQQYLEHRIWSDTEATREANVRVIERPALPLGTTGLPAAVRYLLGAVIGFLVGWVLAVWIELLKARENRAGGIPDRRSGMLESEGVDELAYVRRMSGHRMPERRIPGAPAAHAPRYLEGTLPVLGEFRPVTSGEKR